MKRVGLAVTAAALAGTWTAPAWAAPAEPAVVRIDSGEVRGQVLGDQRVFLGIPYAAPPVGDLRWRAPQPPPAWADVRNALTPGAICPQGGTPGKPNGSEDCLFVNVVTPTATSSAKRPVMVWIHGGGMSVGSGADFDGRRLATEGDLVFVSMNYRLASLGQLVHPGLEPAGSKRVSGDATLEDQQEALRWVQRNIAAFGGDKDNVTIFGESGGGWSVCAQLASPTAAGLFHKAIVQSGACTAQWAPSAFIPDVNTTGVTLAMDKAVARGRSVARHLGCEDAKDVGACLRGVSLGDYVIKAGPDASVGLPVGGATLPIEPSAAFAQGTFNKAPVMIGATRDEHRLFVMLGYDLMPLLGQPGGAIDARKYDELVRRSFGAAAPSVLKRYPLAKGVAPGQQWAAVTTDSIWSCPTAQIARDLAKHTKTYLYEFTDETAPGPEIPGASFKLGAYHSGELQYLTLSGQARSATFQTDQATLSERMVRYWINFARTGDPNGAGLPAWKPTPAGEDKALALGPGAGGVKPTTYWQAHNCDLWAGVAPVQP